MTVFFSSIGNIGADQDTRRQHKRHVPEVRREKQKARKRVQVSATPIMDFDDQAF